MNFATDSGDPRPDFALLLPDRNVPNPSNAAGFSGDQTVSPPTFVESLPSARYATQAPDESPLGSSVLPHLSMLRQVAQRILGCSGQADDAVQDAIIALWHRAEPPVELRGWLVKTVIHRSLHRRRTEMRRQRWEEEASIESVVTCPLCDPEEEFAHRELLAVAEAAVSGLTREHRIVIELRSRGEEYDEIARRLNLPIGTVRSRLNRARRALREQLSRDGL
jgi:RNA polymerase sigma-70 factor (ECF subfamily)